MIFKSYIAWVIFIALGFSCDGSARNFIHRFHLRMLINPPLSPNVTQPAEQWFTQLLDHFQPTDTRTWQQRYGVAKDFYEAGGPVFVMIWGEGPADPQSMLYMAWADYAKKYKAMLFLLEHRYYGKSQPTSDLSVENLKYLSSEQALADIAYFIVAMNSQHQLPPNTKWVAFGGSYAGNLAAWVRLKYPHLIHASVSSSGPVLAKVDFPEYLDVVKDSLATHSSQCVEAIEAANKQFNILLKTRAGRKTIEKKFRLCDPIDSSNKDDIANLLEEIADTFAGAVQYDNQLFSIDLVCDIMVNKSMGTPIDRLAAENKGESCLEYRYDNMIQGLRVTSWEKSNGGRQWFYQTCTEFGFFQSSESKNALFGEDFSVDFFIQQCKDVFGNGFTKELVYRAVERSNIMYGGLDLKATRVVYVHGSIDPWHALGITKTRIPESPAIYINGTSHCANMQRADPSDPPALKAAREEISTLIGKWLQEPFTKELVYRAIERSNIMHGGLDLKATRVVYVHGSIDPWHALGITKTRIPQSPAIYINGVRHCANMGTPAASDPPALKATREEISTLIGKWLQEP